MVALLAFEQAANALYSLAPVSWSNAFSPLLSQAQPWKLRCVGRMPRSSIAANGAAVRPWATLPSLVRGRKAR